ncbi:hypothetical protein [Ligilactobacillus ruminis]|uniref:hypothetical protein n=1 Tax=Ligilactobacillus ruminis TaxID=1623 RepID=UPI00325A668D
MLEIVWRADLACAAFGKITDTSMKMGRLSVNVLLQKRQLRTKWAKMAVCP